MSGVLEKIDIIRNRAGVSYSQAKQALDSAGGDLVQALIFLEEGERHACCGLVHGFGGEMAGRVKNLWKQGQKTRVRLKKDGRTVFEVPANVGVLGILGAAMSSELAFLGAAGGALAMIKDYKLEIDRGEQNQDSGPGAYFGSGNTE